MVEKLNYTYEELEKLFNNIKNLNVKTREIIKTKDKISTYRDKSEKDEKDVYKRQLLSTVTSNNNKNDYRIGFGSKNRINSYNNLIRTATN